MTFSLEKSDIKSTAKEDPGEAQQHEILTSDPGSGPRQWMQKCPQAVCMAEVLGYRSGVVSRDAWKSAVCVYSEVSLIMLKGLTPKKECTVGFVGSASVDWT